MYAPYDQPTYQAVLELLKPEDVVLDIGAGDFWRVAGRQTVFKRRQWRHIFDVDLHFAVAIFDFAPDSRLAVLVSLSAVRRGSE